jgi:hypothetical protein
MGDDEQSGQQRRRHRRTTGHRLDNDTILDGTSGPPTPSDGPAYLDPTDGDCIPDAVEAGDGDLNTFPPDTDLDGKTNPLDIDSDNDGLADGDEDADCNGLQGGGESSSTDADSDDDTSRPGGDVAGTDPTIPTTIPRPMATSSSLRGADPE